MAADALMQAIVDVADRQHEAAAAAAESTPQQHAVGRLMRQRVAALTAAAVHPMVAADTTNQ